MADYICLKPCRFGGTDYKHGDMVPEDVVLPQRAGALIRTHIIGTQTAVSAVQVDEDMDNDIYIPILSNNDLITITVTAADVQQVMAILQLPEEQALPAVAVLEKEDALIMLAVIDARSSIRAVIQPLVSKMVVEIPEEPLPNVDNTTPDDVVLEEKEVVKGTC